MKKMYTVTKEISETNIEQSGAGRLVVFSTAERERCGRWRKGFLSVNQAPLIGWEELIDWGLVKQSTGQSHENDRSRNNN